MNRLAALLCLLLTAACSSRSSLPTAVVKPSPGQALTVQLGLRPVAPSVAEGSMWVPNSGEGTLTKVDARTGRIVRTISIGSMAGMIAQGCTPASEHAFYSGSFLFRHCDLPSAARAVRGSIWVAKNDGMAIQRLDPKTGDVVATVAVGNPIWDLAATPEMVWATDYFSDSAVRIDPRTNQVVARLTGLPHGPTGVAIGEGAVWIVTSSGGGHLVRVDPVTNQVAAVMDVGKDPMGVVAALGSIWVENEFDGTVTRIDARTNAVLATIKVNAREGREGLDTLIEYRGGIWLGGYQIQMIDPASNSVIRQIRPDAIALAAGPEGLWATTIFGNLVRVNADR